MIAKADKLDFGKETREKKKKKKKAREVKEDALDVEPVGKTKPSQKSVDPPDVVLEIPPLKKKKKKKKAQEAESTDRASHEDSMEAETLGGTSLPKKYHSKKELLPNLPELPCQGKKKKRKTKPSLDLAETEVCTEPEGSLVRKSKKRKKDKRSDQESFGKKETPLDPVEERKECESMKQGQREEKQEPDTVIEACAKKKKKKKKKTYREEEKEEARIDKAPIEEGHIEDPSDFSSCQKKSHKKKQPKDESVESVALGGSPKNIKKKEKKYKIIEIQPPLVEEPARKKKKVMAGRKSVQDPQGPGMGHESDLEVVSEKKGNLDEVTIDTVRRKALQEEIDRESGKTETLETKVEAPTQFGQWDTATFENSDQKMKFLRLMGGFKNSSSSLSRSPCTLGKPNMALNKQAAATLQQNLQEEFDRAMGWKQQRGVGLGYSASASKNKLFYIDRNASRSVKFND